MTTIQDIFRDHFDSVVNLVTSKQLNKPFNFHKLRHTHATLMLESNRNFKVVQERLGHKNASTKL